MIPWRSGNSPTMWVRRSHLPSSAARSAGSTAPPMVSAIAAPSARTRRVLSPSEPSFAWKVTASSAGARAARGCLRSCSQKKAASARRARTTRSLPSRTFAGSRLSMLLTAMKAGRRRPEASHREVTLVVRERRDQHFPRQREEALLEAPRERHRPLGERRHLIEERGGDERAAARVRRRGRDLGPDALAARRQIREHTAALAERALVGSGACDADRSRRVKAMTAREVAGRGVEERRGDHLASEQHHHPVHRAHEHRSALAPVHAARNGQRIEHLAHEVGQQINRALAGLRADEEEEFPFAFVELLERLDARAAALGEGERGARRLPSRTEGGGKGRSAALHVLLGLPRGEALRPHRQAPRGGKARELPVREARLVEPRGKSRHERLLERAQRPRRQLLGADLEEEVVTLTPHAALVLHAAAPGAPPAAAARTGVAAFSSGNPRASRDSR